MAATPLWLSRRNLALLTGFLVCFTVSYWGWSITRELTAPEGSTPQAEAAVGTGSPVKEDLFGAPGVLVPRDTGLHLIHFGVLATMAGLIYLAARMSQKNYVRRWATAWMCLAVAYAYRLFVPFIVGDAPTTFSTFILYPLNISSTLFVLLTGLHLRDDERELRRDRPLTIGFIVAHTVIYLVDPLFQQYGIPLRDLSDASLACVATIFTGWQLTRRAPRRFPGGIEIPFVFAGYALIQLGGMWTGSQWSGALFAAALLLKVPCGLSVVALAMSDAFKQKVRAVESTESANLQLQAVNDQLKVVNQELQDVNVARDLLLQKRHVYTEALDGFSRIAAKAPSLQAAFGQCLDVTLRALRVERGALYLICSDSDETPAGKSYLVLVAATGVPIERKTAFHRFKTGEGEQELRNVARALLTPSEPICLSLGSPPIGWLVAEPGGNADESIVEPLDLALDRLPEALELVLSREILLWERRVRAEFKATSTVSGQLEFLCQHAAEMVGACDAVVITTDEKGNLRHSARWPVLDPGQFVKTPPEGEVDRKAHFHEDPSRAAARSSIRLPLKGLGGRPMGVLRCSDKRAPVPELVSPFYSHFDFRKLEIAAEIMAVAVERSDQHRNLEVLLTRGVHELRHPIVSLRNTLRGLRKRPDIGDDVQLRLTDAAGDTERMNHIVDKVDPHRPKTKEPPRKIKIYLDVIKKLDIDVRQKLANAGDGTAIRIDTNTISIIPELWLIQSDLESVLANLVDNAFKYRSVGETFRMEFAGDHDHDSFILRVKDWGIGVPPGWEDKIFEDGARAPNAEQQTALGFGIGLWWARRIARDLGGDLTLKRGKDPTEFVLFLPRGLKDAPIH